MKLFDNYAILEGNAPALVVELSSTIDLVDDASKDNKVTISPKNYNMDVEFYPWGKSNNTPQKLLENAYKNNVVASNLDFNARISYGDGILPVKKVINSQNKIEYIPLLPEESEETKEIFEFLENSNIQLLMQEVIHDVTLLGNSFVELIMNKRLTKVVLISHKEAAFSRISIMDENTKKSEYHGYSSKWGDANSPDDVVVTPLLDFDNPLYDFKKRNGMIALPTGGKKSDKSTRYMLHLAMPSPGRFYYQKLYWWSIFPSHWFDFSCAIPEFKMNLMKNMMVLKYHVTINDQFFPNLFKKERITDETKMMERKQKFYQSLEDFLSGKENAGKNIVSEFTYDVTKGVERQDIIITPIKSFIQGGEYIEDSEEASNAICYAMGVHPSLQGASPGKSKNINGTEARELFIIKQSMMKPLRDMILEPLRLVSRINNWSRDIEFMIPNIMLTTLDKNTGAEKSIGNTKL
ncbi:MAG: hypothetical protein AAGU18_10755 [Proteiniphilum sp.]